MGNPCSWILNVERAFFCQLERSDLPTAYSSQHYFSIAGPTLDFLVSSTMAGYSGTPLQKKLGIKPGFTMFLEDAPKDYFNWISPLPEKVSVKTQATSGIDFIHMFVKDQKTFRKLFVKDKKLLKPDGMLWVSWPKKSSKVPTDLDENIIRDFGLSEGLVDVKVCAVDEVWSGLKFVVRLKDR